MNILFITDDITSTGGAITFVQEIAKEFSKKHNVYIIAGNLSSSIKNTSLNKKIQIFFYKSKKIPFIELDIGALIYLPKIFDQVVKKIRPDVIYLHLYSSPFSIFLLRRNIKVPIYLYVYGIWHKETLSSISKPKKHKYLGKIKRLIKYGNKIVQQYLIQFFCVVTTKYIITLSDYAKEILIKAYPINKSKVYTIPGGYDPKIFYPVSKTKKISLRKNLGFSENSNILLIATRIERRKNIHVGIQALPYIIKEHKHTMLLIIFPFTAHSYFDYLLECIALVEKLSLGKHIRFIVGIKHEEIAQYYQIADCFLMLSEDYETFGLTTIESLACGIPVFGMSSSNTKDLLKIIDPFFLFEKNKPEIISKHISRYFSLSDKKKHHLSKKCSRFASTFIWERVCKLLIDMQLKNI